MFNRTLFASALSAHLADYKGLREAARHSGVSASTLSRLAHGESPDIETFDRLCTWMRQPPSTFFTKPEVSAEEWLAQSPYPSPLAMVIYALYGDSRLPAAAKEKLVDLVKAAYQCLVKESDA